MWLNEALPTMWLRERETLVHALANQPNHLGDGTALPPPCHGSCDGRVSSPPRPPSLIVSRFAATVEVAGVVAAGRWGKGGVSPWGRMEPLEPQRAPLCCWILSRPLLSGDTGGTLSCARCTEGVGWGVQILCRWWSGGGGCPVGDPGGGSSLCPFLASERDSAGTECGRMSYFFSFIDLLPLSPCLTHTHTQTRTYAHRGLT